LEGYQIIVNAVSFVNGVLYSGECFNEPMRSKVDRRVGAVPIASECTDIQRRCDESAEKNKTLGGIATMGRASFVRHELGEQRRETRKTRAAGSQKGKGK